jgi:diguanylate cyclase (GGDEF)-like protein
MPMSAASGGTTQVDGAIGGHLVMMAGPSVVSLGPAWLLLFAGDTRGFATNLVEKLFPGIGEDESEQILVRWLFLATLWVFLVSLKLIDGALLGVMVAQMVLATGHTIHARLRPESAAIRRKAGVLVDQVPCVALTALASPVVAPLFFMFATVSVGYGLRFGPNYGLMSALVCGLGLSVVTVLVPAYRAEWIWMLSIIGLVTLVPVYSAYLAVRLQRRQERMKEESARLLHAATHDAMTGLANRAHFVEVLATMLQQRVGRRHALAVLFIDLDGFKGVNDRSGHAAGDALLCRVAQCLQSSVRSGDLVARIGGDEFAVLVCEVLRTEEVPLIIGALEARLRTTFTSAEIFEGVGASIGSATYDGGTPCPVAETLLKEADAAMYAVKAKHRTALTTAAPLVSGAMDGASRLLEATAQASRELLVSERSHAG